MSTGYICILSCEKEPDSIALYCTEYRPESAIKRLNTKLSSTFYIEFIVLVNDPAVILHEIRHKLDNVEHHLLDQKLVYGLTVEEASDVLRNITGQEGQDILAKPDFFQETILCESLQSIPVPSSHSRVSKQMIRSCEESLVGIGRQGCPTALKTVAEVYEKNEKNSLKFKTYWREYLELSLKKCEFYGCRPASLGCTRSDVARDSVQYLWMLTKNDWLELSDVRFIKSFLLSGDKLILREFLDILRNEWGMDKVRAQFKKLQ